MFKDLIETTGGCCTMHGQSGTMCCYRYVLRQRLPHVVAFGATQVEAFSYQRDAQFRKRHCVCSEVRERKSISLPSGKGN